MRLFFICVVFGLYAVGVVGTLLSKKRGKKYKLVIVSVLYAKTVIGTFMSKSRVSLNDQ